MNKIITTLAIATLVLAGCTDKKSEDEETTATETTQEVSAEELSAPKVTPEEGKSLITKLYSELYTNEKLFEEMTGYFGDKLKARLIPVVMDYDPFITVQDYDAKSIQNSLTITELSEGLFQVEVEPFEGIKVTLQLTLGYDDNGVLKVLDIPSDPNISVLK